MVRLAERSRGGVAVAIGPGCYVGEVRRAGVAQDVLRKGLGFRANEVLRDVGNGLMAQGSPSVSAG